MSMMRSDTPTIWSIHDGSTGGARDLFQLHDYIALGWPITGPLDLLPNDQDAFKAKVIETGAADAASAPQIAGQLRHFVYDVRIGDIVVYRPAPLKDMTPLILIGRVTGPYLHNPYVHPHYSNVRKVEWLRSVPVSSFSKDALAEQSAAMTLSKIDTHAQEYLAALDGVL
ncbi:MAG TPA: hypothetical protein VFX24_06435 [Ktedonobacterales bacterium]|nr:hypothetical protein [Ktedonobacterales bacterium]